MVYSVTPDSGTSETTTDSTLDMLAQQEATLPIARRSKHSDPVYRAIDGINYFMRELMAFDGGVDPDSVHDNPTQIPQIVELVNAYQSGNYGALMSKAEELGDEAYEQIENTHGRIQGRYQDLAQSIETLRDTIRTHVPELRDETAPITSGRVQFVRG